jgi:hypothetical protein
MVNMKLLFALIFLSGCSLFIGGKDEPKTAKGTRYSIPFSLPHWVYKKDKRSDYVFENNIDGRIILSNSFCEEFQEQPLEQLAKKTFKSINEFKSRVSEYTTYQNREAYQIEGTGKVDGVPVNLRLLNTRRDNCYFDFLSINPEKTSDTDQAFETFLKTVSFK